MTTSSEINLLQKMLEEVEPTSEELAAEGKITNEDRREMMRIIEALLFSTHEPIALKKLREVVSTYLPIRTRQLGELIAQLQEEYKERSFQIEEVAGGLVLRSQKRYADYIHRLRVGRRGERLSHAAAEVLAIIAYRQPITRPEVDRVRGVDSSGAIQGLLERGVIEAVGKAELPGRPSLYATTQKFLHHFGLSGLADLPQIG